MDFKELADLGVDEDVIEELELEIKVGVITAVKTIEYLFEVLDKSNMDQSRKDLIIQAMCQNLKDKK